MSRFLLLSPGQRTWQGWFLESQLANMPFEQWLWPQESRIIQDIQSLSWFVGKSATPLPRIVHWHNYGKSQFVIGKSSINGDFSSSLFAKHVFLYRRYIRRFPNGGYPSLSSIYRWLQVSGYPLVNVYITMGKSPFIMGKLTISMAIFNSFWMLLVCLPAGISN